MPRSAPNNPPTWNPADYAANAAAQHAWASELLPRLHLQGHEHLLDVGCGDGHLTAQLARLVPRGRALGIDSSTEMIAHARLAHPHSRHPNLRFEVMDARHFQLASPVDTIFSNATLHWVDDHPAFLRAAAAALKPGGHLLVSCGGHGNAADVFKAVRAVMRDPRWRNSFKRMSPPYHFHRASDYLPWLQSAGFRPGLVHLVPKDMVQPSRSAFAGWLRTTWLPYTQRVPEPLRATFLQAAIDRYLQRHPADPQGYIHVRMVRLEIEATRQG